MAVIFTAQDLGRAFREERRTLGRTQQWIADQVGCRRQTIVDLEAGRNVTLETLLSALAALGKRLDVVDARLEPEQLEALLDRDDDED